MSKKIHTKAVKRALKKIFWDIIFHRDEKHKEPLKIKYLRKCQNRQKYTSKQGLEAAE